VPDRREEDQLFQVDPEQFVAARNALAKKLKSEGRREEAARVAKLRRPGATVWALNQVARSSPSLINSMLAVGAHLRDAMERALEGDASGVRNARLAESRAVDEVVAAAASVLGDGGHAATDTARQRMTETLRAAIVDDAVAGHLRAGTLDGDRQAPGFGLDAISFPAAPRLDRPRPARDRGIDAETAEKLRQRRARQAELTAEAERRTRRAERLAFEAAEAERRASEARAAADQAAAEAKTAQRGVEEAEAEEQAATAAEEEQD